MDADQDTAFAELLCLASLFTEDTDIVPGLWLLTPSDFSFYLLLSRSGQWLCRRHHCSQISKRGCTTGRAADWAAGASAPWRRPSWSLIHYMFTPVCSLVFSSALATLPATFGRISPANLCPV